MSSEKISDNTYLCKSLVNSIDDFCNRKDEIMGSGWNEFKTIFSEYGSKLGNISNLSSEFEMKISQATTAIQTCLDSYSGVIPIPSYIINIDATLSDINERVTTLQREVSDLESRSNFAISLPSANGEEVSAEDKYKYYSAMVYKQSLKRQLAGLQEELDNLKKYESLVTELHSIKNEFEQQFFDMAVEFNNISKNM